MANERPTFDPTQAQANRARSQGLGVGQREMDLQGDPTRDQHATDPREPLPEAAAEPPSFAEADNPELDWGEAVEGATYSANHTRRPVKTEAERGQGPKTRARTKDIINRKL